MGLADYDNSSVVYMWHDEGMSVGLHITPAHIKKEKLDLGTITRLTHYTLSDVNSFPDNNLFLLIHYIPSSNEIHLTMLPVGDDAKHEALDAQLKTMDGFGKIMESVINLCCGKETRRMDTVKVMYNAPEDVCNGSGADIAVVHELTSRVDDTLVASFMKTVLPDGLL